MSLPVHPEKTKTKTKKQTVTIKTKQLKKTPTTYRIFYVEQNILYREHEFMRTHSLWKGHTHSTAIP